ncbi:MAG: NADPH:quinone oxidoreductase family protein [Microscillaceae bacterium]|nr:NADPH:quinone oxidoreductase family protein [Microscillaceae bacterium]
MKAVLCKEYGHWSNLRVEDIPSPKAGKGQVLIEIKACGVNFPDLLIVEGLYQFKPPLPFSPGAEVAGVVKELGEGVKHLEVGDRVFTGLLFGGYAQEVATDARTVFKIPDDMDFVQAASLMMTYGTSYHALVDRARIRPDETLLVLGAAGGVGLAAMDIAKALGAKVIAAASTDEKLEFCKAFGADEVINYNREDLKERIKTLTKGQGVNVIYDPVGGDFSESAFRSIAWEGRFLVVGFAAGQIPKIPLNLPLLKGADIIGVFWGAFTQRDPRRNMENMQAILSLFQEGKLRNHIHATYSLEQVQEALREVAQRKVIGKVVLLTES